MFTKKAIDLAKRLTKMPLRPFMISQAPQLTRRYVGASSIIYRQFATQPTGMKEIMEILESPDSSQMRNLAIIAHVDHGKTTLVDCLLKQTGISFDSERAMDSNDLEQERGITILSKCTSVVHGKHRLNIVDTPGHQDFGGEVERIMTMVDGVCLVVCATEGPMPQTKFVLKKALQQGLKPIVVINKVDRVSARVEEVENEIFDLFCNLDANDDQLEYPIIYAAARDGWALNDLDKKKEGVTDLLDTIVEAVPGPKVSQSEKPLMLITQTESNQYFGKMLIGRVKQGKINLLDKVQSVDADGKVVETAKIMKIVKRFGVREVDLQTAYAGDIVSIAGFSGSTVGHTINVIGETEVIPSIPIDPPMLAFTVTFNDSPLKGIDGDKLTMSQIRDRFNKEAQDDVSLRVNTETGSSTVVIQGRGDLHLGVILEKMRREGYEMAISPPSVVTKKEGTQTLEPYEEVSIDTDLVHVANIVENLNHRKGMLMSTDDQADGRVLVKFKVPSRGMLGFRNYLIAETRGTAQLQSQFMEYDEWAGEVKKSHKGAIISTAQGVTTSYTLQHVQEKGPLFVGPNTPVYEGMVIGEHVLETDMEMNPIKEKKLTNIRTKGSEDKIQLIPPRLMSLEECVAILRSDELVEITPKWIRMRKRVLNSGARQRAIRNEKNAKQGK